jgi:hypothetical protein
MRVKEASSGVLSLLNTGDVPVEVWGVDDMEAIKLSYGAMAAVRSLLGTRDRVFAGLRPWLRRGQDKLYPKALSKALAGELSMYVESIPLVERAKALKEAAGDLRLELKDFPALRRFLEIADIEKTIDAGRARQQTVTFVERLTQRLHNWYSVVGPNRVHLDLAKAGPIIEYWLETTGQSKTEFEQKIRSGGAEQAFLALKDWIDAWLIEKAMHRGPGGQSTFYEEMMRLALRLDVTYFDLMDFRKGVAINRDSSGLKVTLPDEISEASRWLAGKMPSPEAQAFWESEKELDIMFRAMGLALPPADAEGADISPARFEALLKDLSGRIGQAPPLATSELRGLGPSLEGAGDFVRLSRGRSLHMVERALELMRAASADRIVLVVGGFHERTIVRELEDHREVSWSVIVPKVELPRGSGTPGSFWT